MKRSLALLIVFAACVAVARMGGQAAAPTFARSYALESGEGVFAYARISPSGRHLAYASERSGPGRRPMRTIKIVELATGAVVFSEPGIDAYWSPDGQRVIFLAEPPGGVQSVSILNMSTMTVARDVAPRFLGDYFSWATVNGRDLIVTIEGNYYALDGDRAVLPAGRVPRCSGGATERPLVSKDGTRLTTFLGDQLVVRNRLDCDAILNTGIGGAKADFSWDGRYIAFHAPKPSGGGYEIQIVDLQARTLRRLTGLSGSSFFPSWTRDGRLSFRYDGDDYRGFLLASGVLTAPEAPLPVGTRVANAWSDIFPGSPLPGPLVIVQVWATWSAHSADALKAAEDLSRRLGRRAVVLGAVDVGSRDADVQRMKQDRQVRLPHLAGPPSAAFINNTTTQMPMTLLFVNGELAGKQLGAKTSDQLYAWLMHDLCRVSAANCQEN